MAVMMVIEINMLGATSTEIFMQFWIISPNLIV